LKLRRATVREAAGPDGPEQGLVVELAGGERRPAVADVPLVGACQVGDEVLVNVQARDLGLGSGGFDIVHANLSRGLAAEGVAGAHVMKLNYSSLQHAVRPVEEGKEDGELALPSGRVVAVLALHGQLAPLAWAFAASRPEARLGFVQTLGGALPGGHSRAVRELRGQGLLTGHITAGSTYGGEAEAITTAGALAHGFAELGWDAAVCGPGPGIVGSGSTLGHGGVHALDSAHTALALGMRPVMAPRASSADPRPRHRGISHHTITVLRLLLAPVTVAVPLGVGEPSGVVGGPSSVVEPSGIVEGPSSVVEPSNASDPDVAWPPAWAERMARHDWRRVSVDLEGYERSGLPAITMGRSLSEDPLFFAAAMAGGRVLGET
jgi:hypothetical protein